MFTVVHVLRGGMQMRVYEVIKDAVWRRCPTDDGSRVVSS